MAAQDYEQVTYNGPAGAQIGQSATEKVAFYGAAPVAQYALITAVATTAATSTTNAYGYTTATQADAIVTSLNAVIDALKDIGIVATA
jgi:ribosome-interacting GTPase 1